MNVSGPNQPNPMINEVFALALGQQPNAYVFLATAMWHYKDKPQGEKNVAQSSTLALS